VRFESDMGFGRSWW